MQKALITVSRNSSIDHEKPPDSHLRPLEQSSEQVGKYVKIFNVRNKTNPWKPSMEDKN